MWEGRPEIMNEAFILTKAPAEAPGKWHPYEEPSATQQGTVADQGGGGGAKGGGGSGAKGGGVGGGGGGAKGGGGGGGGSGR